MIVVGFGKARHDSSVCIYNDGKILYSKYERECGTKHAYAPDWWFYQKLKDWNVDLKDIDLIVETNTGFEKNGGTNSVRLPVDGDNFYISVDKKQIILDHHLAHSYSNLQYHFPDQTVVIDGCGSGFYSEMIFDSHSINRFVCVSPRGEISPGGVFKQLGYIMGIDSINPAGQVMGLSSYGKVDKKLFDFIASKTDSFKDLRPISNYLTYYEHNKEKSHPKKSEWVDLVATIDELCFKHIESKFQMLDKNKPIVYSGGCALNINWNRRLLDLGYQLKIDPHVYDGGLSVGCLRFGLEHLGIEYPSFENFPYLQNDESPSTIPTNETYQKVAELLADGKVVGWYQGHGELGPRALGNRSILMRPDLKEGKDTINQKVKHREWWRPFGASIKQDKALEYFDIDNSPYMLYTSKVLKDHLHSITHVDGTCRHQTVTPEQNETFYRLLDTFEEKTGLPVLLNTSLNLGGKPIAGTMAEAIELFQTTEMDALCLGNHLLLK